MKAVRVYPNTIGYLRPLVSATILAFTLPIQSETRKYLRHIVWMMDKMQKCGDISKNGRWIGYIIAKCEIAGYLTNRQSRRLIAKDVGEGQI